MVMVVVVCPQCKNRMKYHTQSQILVGKVKRCVYCGRSFQVHSQALKLVQK